MLRFRVQGKAARRNPTSDSEWGYFLNMISAHSLLNAMGGCQNHGPFLGTLNIRCRIIIGTQKGTIILTSTHMNTEHQQA